MAPDLGVFFSLFVDTLGYWWIIIPGTLLGIVVGAIPGFSAANTIIVLLPMTLSMKPVDGMIFMVVLYTASRLGAGIPAILVNIPGTAGAAATPLDGYPMAVAGRGQQALAISFTSSVAAGLMTTIAALILIPWLSQVAFLLHSVEMIVVMLFGISLIATISAEDQIKGLIAGFFGLMIGYIGADVVYEAPRGTFGFLELYDKVPLIPALVGLFAISEAFVVIERDTILSEQGAIRQQGTGWEPTFEGIRETLRHWKEVTWTAMLGLVIGVIPGAGAAIASFVAYQQSRLMSKTPELYGTGHVPGLIAPESANNGVTSGTLIPLLIIGVPGGATAAIMAVVLEYHGINFGPDLFGSQPMIAYGSFTAMLITYLLLGLMILPLTRYFSHVMVVPTIYMAPILIAFTLVGSFVPRDYIFDMGVAIVFGVVGYIARRTGYHVAAILIGVILGPLLENYFLRALRISQGDLMVLFSSTIGNTLWVLLLLSLLAPATKRWLQRRSMDRGGAH
ncbi:MAG TPA: tripartite tricarboxylate transporter permease [Gammaproteobacteria bacterium]|nr:tripartite tricarboxylate transporter permease [Gammaproteobacteria bacterium]